MSTDDAENAGDGGDAVSNDTVTPAAAIRVRGNASVEEVAALVAVLSALGGGDEPPEEHARSAWSDPSWRLVGPSRTRGGWRASGLPR